MTQGIIQLLMAKAKLAFIMQYTGNDSTISCMGVHSDVALIMLLGIERDTVGD